MNTSARSRKPLPPPQSAVSSPLPLGPRHSLPSASQIQDVNVRDRFVSTRPSTDSTTPRFRRRMFKPTPSSPSTTTLLAENDASETREHLVIQAHRLPIPQSAPAVSTPAPRHPHPAPSPNFAIYLHTQIQVLLLTNTSLSPSASPARQFLLAPSDSSRRRPDTNNTSVPRPSPLDSSRTAQMPRDVPSVSLPAATLCLGQRASIEEQQVDGSGVTRAAPAVSSINAHSHPTLPSQAKRD
ncbi:hypothetical protein R3P38DRAFT_3200380 [Favolaschia claudopus]|uniref:Uncharacterized protein n=1 Tax=Favolaschia claudopus TaxID=2862362 RepID=A0AAW0B213_9AGAR